MFGRIRHENDLWFFVLVLKEKGIVVILLLKGIGLHKRVLLRRGRRRGLLCCDKLLDL